MSVAPSRASAGIEIAQQGHLRRYEVSAGELPDALFWLRLSVSALDNGK